METLKKKVSRSLTVQIKILSLLLVPTHRAAVINTLCMGERPKQDFSHRAQNWWWKLCWHTISLQATSEKTFGFLYLSVRFLWAVVVAAVVIHHDLSVLVVQARG